MSKTTTPEQYEKLADLMSTKQDIACGYHNQSKDEVQVFWQEVTQTLNALGPPTKSEAAWKKVWIDWKCYIKRKLSANKKEFMSTGGDNCRLQRISPLEEEVIQLTGLVTNTSGISGAKDFGVVSEVQDEEAEMGISSRSDCLLDVPTTSRKLSSSKDNTLSLLKQQIDAQKEFYEESKNFHKDCLEKCDEVSTHLRRMNRSLEKMAEIAANQLEKERRHNKIKEELLKKKMEIKLRMLKLEHPSFDSE